MSVVHVRIGVPCRIADEAYRTIKYNSASARSVYTKNVGMIAPTISHGSFADIDRPTSEAFETGQNNSLRTFVSMHYNNA